MEEETYYSQWVSFIYILLLLFSVIYISFDVNLPLLIKLIMSKPITWSVGLIHSILSFLRVQHSLQKIYKGRANPLFRFFYLFVFYFAFPFVSLFVYLGYEFMTRMYISHRNGVDSEEEIYRITYYGKGRMPVSQS